MALNISFPDSMRKFISDQVAAGGYSTASEYIRQLIREAQKHQAESLLESVLIEGLVSGEATDMTTKDWSQLRQQVRTRESRSKRG